MRGVHSPSAHTQSAADRRGLGDRQCDECGCGNLVWFAPSLLWNRVKGGPLATDDPAGVLCPLCFMRRGDESLGKQVWQIDLASSPAARSAVLADDLLGALRRARGYIGNPAGSGLARDRHRDGLIHSIDAAIARATTALETGSPGIGAADEPSPLNPPRPNTKGA